MSTAKVKKIGGAAGIAYPIVQMAAQGLVQVGGAEPVFGAGADEILAFFQMRDPLLFNIGAYLTVLSLVVLLGFLGALWHELREIEGENGLLSTVAFGSGLLAASALTNPGWELAVFRVGEGLDPQIARLLFDQGNLNFANSWISHGAMVLAAGIVFLVSGQGSRRIGWASLALALGLFLARVVWTSQIAFAPYVLLWAWMITVGVRLLHQGGKVVAL
jgi:hypothetical protein